MSLQALSDYVVYSKYAHFLPEEKRRETWEEITDRVFSMHEKKYAKELLGNKDFKQMFENARQAVKEKKVLGSQRALQFGSSDQNFGILKSNAKIFNCTSTLVDRPRAFQEIGYVLINGCGAGYSVQKHHIDQLPKIQKRNLGKKTYKPIDAIEGWAECWGVLANSFFEGGIYPQYQGYEIEFDLSDIRPAGALIAGQFKAPGPQPLKKSLDKIRHVFEKAIENGQDKLSALNAHDIICHIADSIISGGVRRSALISLFSKEDKEMAECKTGSWFIDNAQRGRANNSVVLERNKISKEEFNQIFENIKQYGEPGFYFVDDGAIHQSTNPCCLIGSTTIETNNGKLFIKDLVKKFAEGNNFSVKSFDPITNTVVYKKVIAAELTRKNEQIYTINLENYSLNCTGDHKIFTKRGWVKAQYLNEGDFLYSETGERKLISISTLNKQDVFDITVEDTHCFFANGILVHNCEIGFWPKLENGDTGISACNLTEINGAACVTEEEFYKACEHASFLGTLQAGYDSFPYLGKTTEEIIKKEALLGVSITGWMDNPSILFDENILKNGVKVVKDINLKVAKIININPSARLTCTKPSGSASSVLMTGSGIHAQHSKFFLRRVQSNKKEFAGKVMKKKNPIAVNPSVWSTNKTDNVISFPCAAPKEALVKKDLNALNFLEKVKFAYQNWVIPGTNKELGLHEAVTHNISVTVNVAPDEWEQVREYIFANKNYFSGISLLSTSGDLDYDQAPFVEVLNSKELVEKYGDGVPLASGLIVDGLHSFENLWRACDTLMGFGEKMDEIHDPVEPKKPRKLKGVSEKTYANALANYAIELNLFYQAKGEFETLNLKKEWVRRAKQFAERYFNGDVKQMTYCLKHVSIWKDWLDIQREWKDIDWANIKENEQEYTDADTMSAIACSGGTCEKI